MGITLYLTFNFFHHLLPSWSVLREHSASHCNWLLVCIICWCYDLTISFFFKTFKLWSSTGVSIKTWRTPMSKPPPLWKWNATLSLPVLISEVLLSITDDHLRTHALSHACFLQHASVKDLAERFWTSVYNALSNSFSFPCMLVLSMNSHNLCLIPSVSEALSTFPFYVMVSYKSAHFASQLVPVCLVQSSDLLICNSWDPPEFKNRNVTFAAFHSPGIEANLCDELHHS